MNRKKTWQNQGSYKSYKTGKPMLLILNKETGGTELQPLKINSKAKSKAIKKKKYGQS